MEVRIKPDLLSQIKKGAKLNKAPVVNDRSSPLVERSKEASGLNSRVRTRTETAPPPASSIQASDPSRAAVGGDFLSSLTTAISGRTNPAGSAAPKTNAPKYEKREIPIEKPKKATFAQNSTLAADRKPPRITQNSLPTQQKALKSAPGKRSESSSSLTALDRNNEHPALGQHPAVPKSSKDTVDFAALSRIASQKPPPPKPKIIPPKPVLEKKPPSPQHSSVSQRMKEPPPRVPPPPPPTSVFTKDDLDLKFLSVQPFPPRRPVRTENSPSSSFSPLPQDLPTSSNPPQKPDGLGIPSQSAPVPPNSPSPSKPTTSFTNSDIISFGRWTFIEYLPPPRQHPKAVNSDKR